MTRRSTRRRDFGVFLGSIRDSLGETQSAFAYRLNVSRSVIANIETGTPPSEAFIYNLITVFSDKQDAIVAAEKRHRIPHTRKSRRTNQSTVQYKINSQIAADELLEAKDALVYQKKTTKDPDHLIWTVTTLSRVERLLGNSEASRRTLRSAISLAEYTPGHDDTLVRLWEQYAVAFRQDEMIDKAFRVLETALGQFPTGAALWHRKGLFHWDQRDWSNAYAALATALRHKGPRLDILFARGQILLEWGFAKDAIVDLDEVLAGPQLGPLKAICARSARACALFMEHMPSFSKYGDPLPSERTALMMKALDELSELRESKPDSPWPYYFRTMCFKAQYDEVFVVNGLIEGAGKSPPQSSVEYLACARQTMRIELQRALQCDSPPLSPIRIRWVKESLRALECDERRLPSM